MTRMLTLAIASAALLLTGCGGDFDYGPTGTITGRLTMDGEPLPAGSSAVFMEPKAGYLAFGLTDAEGNYTVNTWNEGNMPIGSYRVMVHPPAPANDSETASAEEVMAHPEKYKARPIKTDIPKKYRETATSGLSFEIKKGENKIDIDIKK
ncbi:hypothetical protein Pan44_15410 [Caulifigura coniformis]|uniref:Carboxypeptidase regulatory-like domain-containing protein n=1 Tax=Caulifigura coniformis TaxID=2527983 RepID=A0A517SBK9_9PLAN|nr:hypothetical protein [Caulifigura coniformis]QDT53519.1 hypothetical protein Pan44_15410 [Caulifigura coniformis]